MSPFCASSLSFVATGEFSLYLIAVSRGFKGHHVSLSRPLSRPTPPVRKVCPHKQGSRTPNLMPEDPVLNHKEQGQFGSEPGGHKAGISCNDSQNWERPQQLLMPPSPSITSASSQGGGGI